MNPQILKDALGDCKRINTSTCLIKSSYEIISEPIFFVFDDKNEDPVQIVAEEDYFQLTVVNENNKEVCLVKTDKCLFTDEHKKCDCILFNQSKCFFVEIKDAKTRSSKRRTAVSQLGCTIEVLRDNNIDFSGHETKAIICFKSGITRPTKPSLNTQRAVFLAKYRISLEEGNQIEF